MAVPKKRTSSARRDKRRANWKITPPGLSVCPSCRQTMRPHRVCGNCGQYKGKEVITAGEA